MAYATKTNPVQYSEIYLAQVKKYFLIIKADYTDEKFGKEIERAILTAKFDKATYNMGFCASGAGRCYFN